MDVSATDMRVRWANWTAYLDYDEQTTRYPTLDAFTKKTGIRASYSEAIDDNDAYVAKITPQIRAGQDMGADIIVPRAAAPTAEAAGGAWARSERGLRAGADRTEHCAARSLRDEVGDGDADADAVVADRHLHAAAAADLPVVAVDRVGQQ